MSVSDNSADPIPSLQPKSPPVYPDLYGKRRALAKVQVLEREIGFLEEELKSVEVLHRASICCKQITEFTEANSDPFIPTNKKIRRSFRFWKWFCRRSSCSLRCSSCSSSKPRCCTCTCNPCSCTCVIPKCSIPKCCSCSCPSFWCFKLPSCPKICCVFRCKSCSCPDLSCACENYCCFPSLPKLSKSLTTIRIWLEYYLRGCNRRYIYQMSKTKSMYFVKKKQINEVQNQEK